MQRGQRLDPFGGQNIGARCDKLACFDQQAFEPDRGAVKSAGGAQVLAAVTFAGIAIPVRFFGSPSGMFTRMLETHPHMLVLPLGSAYHGTIWFASTVLLSAIGFFMGPQSFNAIYSARSAESLRRNAMLLPFYQCFLSLMIFAGLSAALIVPGLKGPNVDQSFMLVVARYFPSWVLGFVASAA